MRFGVLGTGQVGSAICRKLAALGHGVTVGSRTPNSEKAQTLAASTNTSMGTYAEAAAYGEWVVNALPGERAIDILRDCDIDGKILIDIANYDIAADGAIEVPIGEAIQRAFPRVRLVKTLNSVSAHLMVDPTDLGKLHHVFIASNDNGAKREVETLLRSFGWQGIIDLGDLTACRAMEQLIPLWMKLEHIFAGPHFNLAVIRAQPKETQQ